MVGWISSPLDEDVVSTDGGLVREPRPLLFCCLGFGAEVCGSEGVEVGALPNSVDRLLSKLCVFWRTCSIGSLALEPFCVFRLDDVLPRTPCEDRCGGSPEPSKPSPAATVASVDAADDAVFVDFLDEGLNVGFLTVIGFNLVFMVRLAISTRFLGFATFGLATISVEVEVVVVSEERFLGVFVDSRAAARGVVEVSFGSVSGVFLGFAGGFLAVGGFSAGGFPEVVLVVVVLECGGAFGFLTGAGDVEDVAFFGGLPGGGVDVDDDIGGLVAAVAERVTLCEAVGGFGDGVDGVVEGVVVVDGVGPSCDSWSVVEVLVKWSSLCSTSCAGCCCCWMPSDVPTGVC